MSDLSKFLSHQGPIGREINALAGGVKPLLKEEAKAALDAAIDRLYAEKDAVTADDIKDELNKEIDKL